MSTHLPIDLAHHWMSRHHQLQAFLRYFLIFIDADNARIDFFCQSAGKWTDRDGGGNRSEIDGGIGWETDEREAQSISASDKTERIDPNERR
jgi:hypothetical protein